MVVSGRNEEKLKELVETCERQFGNKNVVYMVAEAENEVECEAVVKFTIEKFGRLDILVLAAGIAAHSKFIDLESLDIVRKVMNVNFMGYVNMTRYALPLIK